MEQAERLTVFEVRRQDDDVRSSLIAYVFDETEAKILARGQGWYGGDGCVFRHDVVRFADGSTYSLGARLEIDIERAKLILQARAKLTSEEREALGIP